MAETATSIPQKGLGTIQWTDFLKGLWISVGSSILALVYLLINNHWKMPSFSEVEPYLNAIVIGFVSYLGKNLTTNNVGQLFKKDKPVVHVNAEKLQTLEQKAAALDEKKSQ